MRHGVSCALEDTRRPGSARGGHVVVPVVGDHIALVAQAPLPCPGRLPGRAAWAGRSGCHDDCSTTSKGPEIRIVVKVQKFRPKAKPRTVAFRRSC